MGGIGRLLDHGDGLYEIVTPFGAAAVTLYLIRAEQTVLIDAGVHATPTRVVEPALAQIGLALTDVDLVATTHAHIDHRGGLSELALAGARVVASEPERRFIETNGAVLAEVTEIYQRLGCPHAADARRAMIADHVGGPADVDWVVGAGTVIEVGPDTHLEVIETPGHTAGSISFYWRERDGLFSGDALGGQVAAGRLPVTDAAGLVETGLDTIERLEPQTVWMAHASVLDGLDSPPTVVGREAICALVGATREVHEQLLGAVMEVLRRLPHASDADLARAAGAVLTERWQLREVPGTGLPGPVPGTLLSYCDLARIRSGSLRPG